MLELCAPRGRAIIPPTPRCSRNLATALDAPGRGRSVGRSGALRRTNIRRRLEAPRRPPRKGGGEALGGRRLEGADAARPAQPQQRAQLLPAGATSTLIDEVDAAALPFPLPSNTQSAALCVCGGGVLAMASEQVAAFSPKELRYLELCASLIDL